MARKILSLVSLALLSILAMIQPLRFNQVKQSEGNRDEKRVHAPKKPDIETVIEPELCRYLCNCGSGKRG